MVNGLSPEYEWKRNFRMSREMFTELCQKLRPHISPGTTPNYRFLTLEKRLVSLKRVFTYDDFFHTVIQKSPFVTSVNFLTSSPPPYTLQIL